MTEPDVPPPTETGSPSPPNAEVEAAGFPLVTFIFTDIEDSTGHWQRLPHGMRRAQEAHDRLMRRAFEQHGGRVFRTVGDAFCVAFTNASDAVRAALDAQIGMQTVFLDDAGELPLRARIALHTGPAELQDGDFYGLAPARAARVLEGMRGGQIMLTAETANTVASSLPANASLSDLGPCRLRSFEDVEHLFQLHHPGLPLIVTPPRSAVSVPNNLPRQVTAFIGRENEIAEARRRLSQYHLVTLVGMGGCGKTRLSLRLTDFVYSDFPDGIFFADLSGQREDTQVAQVVAVVLGLKPDGATPVLDQVTGFLRDKNLLLILDNCEQILEGACELASAILQAAERVRIIATSREALGVFGESLLPVNPFPTTDLPQYPQLLKWESVRLFTERAVAQSPRFHVTPENASAVASVCRRVEGIPLGLVLTAAWTSDYTPEQIARQLEARFNLMMTGRIRSLPARHRTLYATVDWGYGLLTREEQTLLRRIALFRGGFTPDAARAVCGDGIANVSAALDTLTRKSLLIAEANPTPDALRYRALEPVREYGEERLREDGEWEPLEAAHRAYFVHWAETIAPRTVAPDSRAALEEIDAEQENLQAALRSADAAHDNDAGVRFIASLYWHWHVRGEVQQGRAWIARFLSDKAVGSIPGCKALNGAGVLAYDTNDYDASLDFYQRALVVAEQLGDEEREAGCLGNVGSALTNVSRYAEAETVMQRSLAIYQRLNIPFRAATVLTNLGKLADDTANYTLATEYYQAAIEIQRQYAPSPSLGINLLNLANLEVRDSRWKEAYILLKEAMEVRLTLKNHLGVARVLDRLPDVILELGRPQDAALLLGAARQYRQKIGVASDDQMANDHLMLTSKIAEIIGQESLAAQEYAGRLLNIEELIPIAFPQGE